MSEQAARERDQLTVARLTGAAWRHASGWEPTGAQTAAAVGELREIAGGRGDLLAEVAGIGLGAAEGKGKEHQAQAIAELRRLAGASESLIPQWIEEGSAGPR